MPNEIIILTGTAASIGFIHTVFGPDHYLPFIVLSKARGWSIFKTTVITFLCGIGHILSSVLLGFAGIAFGIAIFKLEAIESIRGELAAWFLIIFGFAYLVWGIFGIVRGKPHAHPHLHNAGNTHTHTHGHLPEHLHIHTPKSEGLMPWILFLIFVFGPCELLIPLIIYPAAKHNLTAVMMVSFIFGLATIITMLGIVLTSVYGLSKLPLGRLEKYSNPLAGLTIFLCGVAIRFLGL